MLPTWTQEVVDRCTTSGDRRGEWVRRKRATGSCDLPYRSPLQGGSVSFRFKVAVHRVPGRAPIPSRRLPHAPVTSSAFRISPCGSRAAQQQHKQAKHGGHGDDSLERICLAPRPFLSLPMRLPHPNADRPLFLRRLRHGRQRLVWKGILGVYCAFFALFASSQPWTPPAAESQ